MQIKKLKDITEPIQDWDREEALILVKGKFYSDVNHQYAVMNFMENYDWDFNENEDCDKAEKETDKLFREGKVVGLDLFVDENEVSYLVCHYPNAFENDETAKQILDYSKEKGYILGCFTDTDKLGNTCYTVELAA